MKKRRSRRRTHDGTHDGPTAEAMRQIAAGVEATTGEALVKQWRSSFSAGISRRTPTSRDYADLARRINLCTAQMVRRALILILRRQIFGEDS